MAILSIVITLAAIGKSRVSETLRQVVSNGFNFARRVSRDFGDIGGSISVEGLRDSGSPSVTIVEVDPIGWTVHSDS